MQALEKTPNDANKQTITKDEELFGTFKRYSPDNILASDDVCTVLHGYGIDAPGFVKYIDDYKFVGGVGRNIPKIVAKAWKNGRRWQDDKPAVSRIYPQAILPNDATEIDFAKATGVRPMEPGKLAAMLGASDVSQLVQALGPKAANDLADRLKELAGKQR